MLRIASSGIFFFTSRNILPGFIEAVKFKKIRIAFLVRLLSK